MTQAISPPEQVDGRYTLGSVLGRGGMGVVWSARDGSLDRPVAVKQIRFPGGSGEQERAAFGRRVLREARVTARLNHPGVVAVYDVVEEPEQLFIVMELVEAPSLAEVIQVQGRLSPQRVAQIGVELVDALRAAHALGIIHRDVKPGNVLVPSQGPIRLTDFGIASMADGSKMTTSEAFAGSPRYMSPEQVSDTPSTAASDLWSLGATLYFAVEGHPPFDAGDAIPTMTAIVNEDPQPMCHAGPLAPVLTQLLNKDPGLRPDPAQLSLELACIASPPVDPTLVAPTMVAAAAAVSPPVTAPAAVPAPDSPTAAVAAPPAVAAGEGVLAGRTTPRSSTEPPRRRLGMLVGAGLGAVALVVLGLTFAHSPSHRTALHQDAAAVAAARRSAPPALAPGSPAATSATRPPPLGSTPSAQLGSSSSPQVGSSPPAGPSQAPAQATNAAATVNAVPTTWVGYKDPGTGFTISYPPGWTVTTNKTLTDFSDPRTGTYMRVDHQSPPGPSAAGAWYAYEPAFAAQNPGYHRVAITPTTFQGFPAAIWEYTYGFGPGARHAIDLGFIVGSKYGFALNFQTALADWQASAPQLESFEAAFRPPA